MASCWSVVESLSSCFVVVVVFHARMQLRILTHQLDWKRCSSSQPVGFTPKFGRFGVFRSMKSLIDMFLISFEISSHFSRWLPAVSQSILLTQIQICFFLGRLIIFECCRVCPSISRRRTRLGKLMNSKCFFTKSFNRHPLLTFP